MVDRIVLATAGLVFLSILLSPLSRRSGAPILLLFLAIGMLLGEDGPGGIDFDSFDIAFQVGSLILAVILFAGGLDTRLEDVRKAAAPAILLASVGVLVTAILVALAVIFLFDRPPMAGLLLGAVVGSTDAAATFLLLRQSGVRLRGRLLETITVESGINDPTAIFLTTAAVALIDAGATRIGAEVLPIFARQLGLGAAIGLGAGFGLAALINRIRLEPGLYPPFCLAAALVVFQATQSLDGSGYLAVYIAGVLLAGRVRRTMERVQHFHEGLAWLGQIVLFLMLGLLVTPSELPGVAGPALVLAAVLIFVARPLAVVACLAPLGFAWREQLFVGWVGLRGAVPIFLAIIPVVSPGPVPVVFFDAVFVIVIASLVLQGWTIPLAARLFGVTEGPPRP